LPRSRTPSRRLNRRRQPPLQKNVRSASRRQRHPPAPRRVIQLKADACNSSATGRRNEKAVTRRLAGRHQFNYRANSVMC
jgi:hypothetical protein